MTKIVANNHDATITANDFALVADLLHAWLNFHDELLLLVTIDNSTSCEVVRTKFYDHTIFWKDANVVLSHLAADVRKNPVPICKFDSKHGVRQCFSYGALNFDCSVFLGQAVPTYLFRGLITDIRLFLSRGQS